MKISDKCASLKTSKFISVDKQKYFSLVIMTQNTGSGGYVPTNRRLLKGPLFLRQRTLSSEPPSSQQPKGPLGLKPKPGYVASRRNSGLRSLSGR